MRALLATPHTESREEGLQTYSGLKRSSAGRGVFFALRIIDLRCFECASPPFIKSSCLMFVRRSGRALHFRDEP